MDKEKLKRINEKLNSLDLFVNIGFSIIFVIFIILLIGDIQQAKLNNSFNEQLLSRCQISKLPVNSTISVP